MVKNLKISVVSDGKKIIDHIAESDSPIWIVCKNKTYCLVWQSFKEETPGNIKVTLGVSKPLK